MAGLRRWLRGGLPIAAVVLAGLALMYPLALLFGLPLARQRMENLSNWVRATAALTPLSRLPESAQTGARAGQALEFFSSLTAAQAGEPAELLAAAPNPGNAVLVLGSSPLAVAFDFSGAEVTLQGAIDGPLFSWGESLEGPLDGTLGGPIGGPLGGLVDGAVTDPAAGAGGRLFRAADSAALASPLYLGDQLLRPGSVESVERADGVRRNFRFTAAEGPVVVGNRLLGQDEVEETGNEVLLAQAPAFNTPVRRITGDYLVVDPAAGLIALAQASELAPRPAHGVLALAERLVGEVDGVNRRFRLQHGPLVETDALRRIYLGEQELSAAAERPAERVDGERANFTFAGTSGIVTVDGREQAEGRDFRREGRTVLFTQPPPRNAALRQYRDYLVSDLSAGAVTLAEAPAAGSLLWAGAYSYYARPACGETAFECFLSMPQHPVPFPHWIAARLGPFFTNYPFSDPRNVVRAVIYTATGTLAALGLGAVLGVLLAVVFVWVRPFERALLPWVIASQTVPIIALVPVLLLLLGNAGITVQASLVPSALIGAYIAFFPVTVGTVTGLRAVDPLALDLMRGYAATPLQVFAKVRFPAAVPFLFTSLKLGTAAALVGALVAEVESNNRRGLGYAIIGQVQAGDVADVWILLIVSALLGIGLVGLVGLLQRLLAPWERK